MRRLFAGLRRRARRQLKIANPRCGAVTFVQRFGGALNLNVHFHTLALDGVFDPDDAEVERTLRTTANGILRLLKRSREAGDDVVAPEDEDRLWAELHAASVSGRIATGPRAGQEVMRFGDRVDPEDLEESSSPRCFRSGGMSLHANVAVPARDRARLDRLCRYVARPPVALDRLSCMEDGRILYALRHRWRDGTTHVALSPLEFVEKLAALIPAPRSNLVRYHGILAPAAHDRKAVVPRVTRTPDDEAGRSATTTSVSEVGEDRPRNYSWAELMRRVFALDVLECPDCRGRMRILATIRSLDAIHAILECLGLPPRAPPVAPPDPDPEPGPDLDIDHVC